ncbi:hypothetical protein F2Q70_00001515 [Brassica cretica]|uniref:Uncharacterized protein n=1 Tax=Brassica cretica TaxID=69181 RepID=A0A8S9J4K6_BRACR|nr:hypothetical protein F2Q70_00001515 [Brassica cretica]
MVDFRRPRARGGGCQREKRVYGFFPGRKIRILFSLHPESTDPRHQKTDSEKPRGKDHAGSTTRSHELEESSRSDAEKATRVIPIFPTRVAEDFVRGVTRVKQRGITHPLARRRSIVEGPTRGG